MSGEATVQLSGETTLKQQYSWRCMELQATGQRRLAKNKQFVTSTYKQ